LIGLAGTYAGIILAHTALLSPFVVVTVAASLTGFNRNLMRAASISGARQAGLPAAAAQPKAAA
jgi:putative spermidine/putrescine transport system permease protein